MLFYVCRLVAKSYKPLKLEVGMYFHTGNSIRQLDKLPQNEEEFIQLNGYPVEFYIVDEGNPNLNELDILAHPEEIGWWDEGDHSDELEEINVKHLNEILQNDGYILIQVEEYSIDDDECEDGCEEYFPYFINDKVVIRSLFDNPEEEEEDDFPDFQDNIEDHYA